MSKRPTCPHCLRPQLACLCGCIRRVHSLVQVLVLQHPLEVGHAKNTARLLHLCLPNSRLEVAEQADASTLHAWLHAPWQGQAADAIVHPVLLYPPTPDDPQLPLQPAPPLPAPWLTQPQQLRLVILDGTWRKSRKMLYLNPGLQQLPRLALTQLPHGRYAIRKAHAPHQLSSFEAAICALAQLQGWEATHPALEQLTLSFNAAMAWHQDLQAQHQVTPTPPVCRT